MGLKSKLSEVLKRQKAHGEDLRSWMHDREVAASKRNKEIAEIRRKDGGRGVTRVPKHLQGLAPTIKYEVKHEDDNYRTRRTMAKFGGSRVERVPTEVLPVMRTKRPNPESDAKDVIHKSKASRGRKVKGNLRSSINQPYQKPRR